MVASLLYRLHSSDVRTTVLAAAISVGFGGLAWGLRAIGWAGAFTGSLVCLGLSLPTARSSGVSPLLSALVALFVLTQVATRFRRKQKERLGLAEPRHGRTPSQILANLAAAATLAALGHPVGALAALAEATADTVASEVGQALRGRTVLITSLRSVTPGTDGGLSVTGTAVGCAGAMIVALVGSRSAPAFWISAAAGIFGLFVDSLLGASLEPRLLRNDDVNFCSTAVAAFCAEWLCHYWLQSVS